MVVYGKYQDYKILQAVAVMLGTVAIVRVSCWHGPRLFLAML